MAKQITLSDSAVEECLSKLEEHGFDLDLLLASVDHDIDSLAPEILTHVQALKLKIALRNKRMQQYDVNLYNRVLRFVGRVQVKFKDQTIQLGNCVLIWEKGFAVTALHTLTAEEEQKTMEASRKRKKTLKNKVQEILVCFPNTSEGILQYKALLVHQSVRDDLALLRAENLLPRRFHTIQTLSSWPRYIPQAGDRVFLLSFPAGKGEEKPISNRPTNDKDYPWCAGGAVTCIDAARGQAFGDYTSFGGASGALLVHPLPDESSYIATIHLGTYHEGVELPTWNRSQLDKLNESLGQKACNGYFSLNVGGFIESYFQSSGVVGKVSPKFLHHQVVRVKKTPKERQVVQVKKTAKEEKDEAVEELDLFGPWPGLDDNAESIGSCFEAI